MEKNNEEYKFYLYKELMEKCREVVYSTSKQEVLDGLPKIVDVLKSIAELEDSSLDKVVEESNSKKRKMIKFNK